MIYIVWTRQRGRKVGQEAYSLLELAAIKKRLDNEGIAYYVQEIPID